MRSHCSPQRSLGPELLFPMLTLPRTLLFPFTLKLFTGWKAPQLSPLPPPPMVLPSPLVLLPPMFPLIVCWFELLLSVPIWKYKPPAATAAAAAPIAFFDAMFPRPAAGQLLAFSNFHAPVLTMLKRRLPGQRFDVWSRRR
eukprot:TRINITY_DN4428_c0_g2_i3.p1 TRINITY_DN4428_c0_g2~~TRINITY_DN4428_c0_g2_i3.p1  ORF type:complete len:141 (-),score=7.91 TRINITY_DN4428_c0_g2_i3:185-607(-)